MAYFAYDLYGSNPVVKKYQFGVTLTAAGIPFTVPASGTAGVVIGTTTGATDLVGLSLDKGSVARVGPPQSTYPAPYTTTQGSGASSAERVVSLIINPFAVWGWKMCQGATEDTALTLHPVTTASSGGTAITTAEDWSSTSTYDEGVTWCYSGANVGQWRKITSVSSTAGTVTIPFDYGTVVGDNFIRVPWMPMQCVTVQLTTALTQADASIAVATGAPFRVIELILRDQSDAGQTNSFVLGCSNSHALNLA